MEWSGVSRREREVRSKARSKETMAAAAAVQRATMATRAISRVSPLYTAIGFRCCVGWLLEALVHLEGWTDLMIKIEPATLVNVTNFSDVRVVGLIQAIPTIASTATLCKRMAHKGSKPSNRGVVYMGPGSYPFPLIGCPKGRSSTHLAWPRTITFPVMACLGLRNTQRLPLNLLCCYVLFRYSPTALPSSDAARTASP